VTYSTIKDLDRGRTKAYDGILHLCVANNWLILKNAKGEPIAVKMAKSVILPIGTKINFLHHVVRVGVCLNPPIMASDLDKPLDKLMISSAPDSSGKEN
jgi:hypothetical protein